MIVVLAYICIELPLILVLYTHHILYTHDTGLGTTLGAGASSANLGAGASSNNLNNTMNRYVCNWQYLGFVSILECNGVDHCSLDVKYGSNHTIRYVHTLHTLHTLYYTYYTLHTIHYVNTLHTALQT